MHYLIQVLLNPKVFYSFLTVLIAGAVLAVLNYILLSKKQNQLFEDEKLKIRDYWQKQILDHSNKNGELSKKIELLTAKADEQAKQIESLNKLEESIKIKEALRNEISAKEKLQLEFKDSEGQLLEIKNILSSKEKEFSRAMNELKEALRLKEEELKTRTLEDDMTTRRLKSAQEQLFLSQNELKLTREACVDLKDMNLDFERQVDALHQALALEKTLHQCPRNEIKP
ncbi:MAG: hypothetical protein A2471_02905 [Omnitrophica WOR_2 bacterium RIFOXYC2_FULL_45_15]|nr:MAG: hypothetical protein A2471_02905 [Omnitrophica WOR_2 bacterium RIFOXYC2_FULL_45_15]